MNNQTEINWDEWSVRYDKEHRKSIIFLVVALWTGIPVVCALRGYSEINSTALFYGMIGLWIIYALLTLIVNGAAMDIPENEKEIKAISLGRKIIIAMTMAIIVIAAVPLIILSLNGAYDIVKYILLAGVKWTIGGGAAALVLSLAIKLTG